MKQQISQELENQINQNFNQLLNRPGMVKCQNFIKIGWKLRHIWILGHFLRSQNFSLKLTKFGPMKLKPIQFSQTKWLVSDLKKSQTLTVSFLITIIAIKETLKVKIKQNQVFSCL